MFTATYTHGSLTDTVRLRPESMIGRDEIEAVH